MNRFKIFILIIVSVFVATPVLAATYWTSGIDRTYGLYDWADVDHHLVPGTTNVYDIGSSTYRVRRLYVTHLDASKGDKVPFNFGSPDITASMNQKVLPGHHYHQTVGSDPSDMGPLDYRMSWDGSVIGISVVGTGISTGIASLEVAVNGVATGLIARFEPGGTQAYNTQDLDTDTFSAGDLLSVQCTTSADFTPSGSPDITATVIVEM